MYTFFFLFLPLLLFGAVVLGFALVRSIPRAAGAGAPAWLTWNRVVGVVVSVALVLMLFYLPGSLLVPTGLGEAMSFAQLFVPIAVAIGVGYVFAGLLNEPRLRFVPLIVGVPASLYLLGRYLGAEFSIPESGTEIAVWLGILTVLAALVIGTYYNDNYDPVRRASGVMWAVLFFFGIAALIIYMIWGPDTGNIRIEQMRDFIRDAADRCFNTDPYAEDTDYCLSISIPEAWLENKTLLLAGATFILALIFLALKQVGLGVLLVVLGVGILLLGSGGYTPPTLERAGAPTSTRAHSVVVGSDSPKVLNLHWGEEPTGGTCIEYDEHYHSSLDIIPRHPYGRRYPDKVLLKTKIRSPGHTVVFRYDKKRWGTCE